MASLDSTPTLMVEKWQFTMTTNHWLLFWRHQLQIVLWLQRMLCRIMGYDFEFKLVKGKYLLIADALSRSQTTSQNRSKFEHEIETTRVAREDQSVTNSLAEIAEVTAHDSELQSVVHHISKGWTNNKRNVPIEILPYWSIKDELSVSGGIVYRNDRIVVPVALRKTLTVKLHQAHMGTESTLRRARTSLPTKAVYCHMRSLRRFPNQQLKRNTNES